MPKIIRPKNWCEFQHYKDRSPIWIKLHKRLLDDYEFQNLPVASRALAPMLWLLASEYDNGDIPGDTRKLAFRLRMTLEELAAAFEPLLRGGFFEIIGNDSETLAEPERVASETLAQRREQVTSNKSQVREEISAVPASKPIPKIHPKVSFPAFYQAYPKHVAKGAALKAYIRACSRASPEVLLAGAQRYAMSRAREDPQFTQNPATWLNADCWLDEDGKTKIMLDPEKAAALQDRSDQLMRRGKYAVDFKDVA